jgi:hypothetical protein
MDQTVGPRKVRREKRTNVRVDQPLVPQLTVLVRHDTGCAIQNVSRDSNAPLLREGHAREEKEEEETHRLPSYQTAASPPSPTFA